MAKKDKKNDKTDLVEVKVEISEASIEDGTKATWLEGTFSVKVPKSVAEKIPAPPSFGEEVVTS